ncbi:hypothetical protein HAX54_036622 [Datura stramonium]|uniref:Uncharacterized protein n=1 Tax=Datura stramonium TaxID=4076 RepID=A0ABS8VJV9_DATST|nr:hypothetical protein [Datura stramonium]
MWQRPPRRSPGLLRYFSLPRSSQAIINLLFWIPSPWLPCLYVGYIGIVGGKRAWSGGFAGGLVGGGEKLLSLLVPESFPPGYIRNIEVMKEILDRRGVSRHKEHHTFHRLRVAPATREDPIEG